MIILNLFGSVKQVNSFELFIALVIKDPTSFQKQLKYSLEKPSGAGFLSFLIFLRKFSTSVSAIGSSMTVDSLVVNFGNSKLLSLIFHLLFSYCII